MRSRVPRRLIATDPEHETAGRTCSWPPGWSPATKASSRSATSRWPGRGRGFAPGSMTTSKANGSCTTSPPPPTAGTASVARTASCTAASGWPRPWSGVTRPGPTLTPTERDFLEASQRQVAAEVQSAAERAKVQARLIRRLRMVLAGAAVLLVLALIAGGIAAVQSNRAGRNAAEARDAAETARQAAVSADARRVGARSQLTDDISLSLLLAAAGARLDDSPETRVNLLAALAKRPHLVRSAPPGGGYLEEFDVSPRRPLDRLLRRSEPDAPLRRRHQPAAAQLRRGPACRRRAGVHDRSVQPRQQAARRHPRASESTEPVRLLDPNTMQPTTKLAFPGGKPVWGVDVQFSADGRYLAATVQHGRLGEQDASRARATRWSGTSAPRPRHPSGCPPAPTSRGWRSARTARPCTRLAADGVRGGDGQADLAARGRHDDATRLST